MSVYLIRHGQSEFNVGSPHEVDPLIFDAPLTDLGKAQANQARREMGSIGVQRIICSPILKATYKEASAVLRILQLERNLKGSWLQRKKKPKTQID